ncbi:MAG: Gldg family protein [Betaproteobacteria bacterium]
MSRMFGSGLTLIAGIVLLATAVVVQLLLLDAGAWTWVLGVLGALATAAGAFAKRNELVSFLQRRRGEITLYTVGLIGIFLSVAWLSTRFPMRWDMTAAGLYSLSDSTVKMLSRLDKPVRITFFHDPMMRETVELYQLIADRSPKVTVQFFDPMINPAQARMMGVQFAGTSLMESEGRRLTVNGPSETEIANGILRISRGSTQRICFLDGHGEPDPFSIESHDHTEGDAGHSHGLGAKFVVHERHGMAKARIALESMNYSVEKVSLSQTGVALDTCGVLVVVGPQSPLLPREVEQVQGFIDRGGNALLMLDPFIKTGLEPVVRSVGVVLDDDLVIDDASHFWSDPSAPAVTDYNRHQLTQDLPLSFFPGARSLSPTPQRVPNTYVMPLANTSKHSFGEVTRDRAEFDPGQDMQGPLTVMAVVSRRMDAQDLDDKAMPAVASSEDGAKPAAAGDTSRRKSRIVVVGDSDFATNSFFHIMGNGKLFLNTINFLAAQENLIGVEPRTFDVPRVNLTNRQMKGTFFLSVILIPALLALVGTIVWWRQR